MRTTEPRQQLLEVLKRFNLFRAATPLQRCLRCNALLQSTSAESVRDRLPPRTLECYQQFPVCPGCDRLYWAGSHYEHMRHFIKCILATSANQPV